MDSPDRSARARSDAAHSLGVAGEPPGATPLAPASEPEDRASEYSRRARDFLERAERLAPGARRARIVAGLAFAAAAVLLIGVLVGSVAVEAWVGAAGALLLSAVFIARHARLARMEDDARRWHQVNERAAHRSGEGWRELPDDGADLLEAEHAYAGDLDLFGPASLFQWINVAHTGHGRRALSRLLTRGASLAESVERQRAVRRLAAELELRQRLETLTLRTAPPAATRRLIIGRASAAPARPEVEALLEWAEAPPRLSQRRVLVWAARLLPPLTLAAFAASQAFDLGGWLWQGSLSLQLMLALGMQRQSAIVAGVVSHWQGVFARLGAALRLLEEIDVDAPLVQRLRDAVRSAHGQASVELERLDRILAWFALRDSEWGHFPVNVLLAWDIHCLLALERWQQRSGRALDGWLESLGQLEALSALAGLAHEHPELTFPELAEGPASFSAVGLGHPLIPSRARVSNDVQLPEPGRALLVTGSNMSGKSTLLRAMGLASVMAFAGAPVCARRLRVGALSVQTSLRVNDSLSDGVSRFYAELQRLRAMLAAARGPLPVLFLVDEILAGTNSVERGVGARWVLGELLRAGALGAVSTHDAQLCQLPAELMARVEQVHFREGVKDDQLTFDYRLRPGPVKAGNALRLMRSLGLAVT